MPEEFEEQPAQQFDLDRCLDIVRRRHLVFLTLLLLGWGVVWGASWLLPPRYKSSTLILVEPPSMPKNYVVPNVNNDLQDQIQSITQQITSRTRLLQIIDKWHLYQGSHDIVSADSKVETMRKDISIELVRGNGNDINSFRVSYSAADPHVAQQVTSDLTNLFIDENLSVRQQQSQDTTQFLQGQLNVARSNLAEQDEKVRAFQSAHQGSLPTQEASNLQILGGLQSQLQNEQDALNAARQQRVYHQSMVDQYRALDSAPRSANGAPTGLAAIDQQLATLRAKLADLRAQYTDRYPEVQDVKLQISRAEAAREQLIANLTKGAASQSQDKTAAAEQIADPALNAPLSQFQSQLKADGVEVATREQAIANLKSRIDQYQARLAEEPAIAQKLADLTRGYTQSQTNYDDLLKKVSDSQMATNMEQMQEGERFTMLDPPSLPVKPFSPNRLKMCAIGLAAGIGLGVLAIALLEFLDDRLHSDKDIENLLPAVVVSEIPEIVGPADEMRKRTRMVRGWAMAVTVTAIILAGAVFSYLKA